MFRERFYEFAALGFGACALSRWVDKLDVAHDRHCRRYHHDRDGGATCNHVIQTRVIAPPRSEHINAVGMCPVAGAMPPLADCPHGKTEVLTLQATDFPRWYPRHRRESRDG